FSVCPLPASYLMTSFSSNPSPSTHFYILSLHDALPILIGFTWLFSYGIYKFKSVDDDIYMSNDFFLLKRTKQMNYLMVILLGFFRNKLTLSLIGIVSILAVLSYLDTRDIFITL